MRTVWRSLLPMVLGAVLALGPAGCRKSAPRTQPAGAAEPPARVVLVSIDTLRADRLGCYGYGRPTSPNLDALARESVVFETVGAPSAQTLISHKALFAARMPLAIVAETTHARLSDLVRLPEPQRFVESVFANMKPPLLVDLLRQAGYRTAAFTDARWMTRAMGFDQGFDDFNDDGGHLARILPRVDHWLRRAGGGRFFLFVHTYDTHCPYVCREPYNSLFCKDHTRHVPLAGKCGKPDLMNTQLRPVDLTAISDHYDGGIASADAYLGDLFATLRERGLYDDALIVVTSDHGESLGEHGQIGHGGLYLEQLLVPLIVKFPKAWGIGPRRVSRPVALIDVMPTVLQACGVALPAGLDGRSLLPLVRGQPGGRDVLLAQITYNEGREAVTNPAKRAALRPGGSLLIDDARAGVVAFFDLTADPRGLRAAPPAAGAGDALRAAISAADPRAAGPFTPPRRVELDEATRRQLKALGYVQP